MASEQQVATPAEFGALQDVARAAQAMIYRVAETGSGKYLAEVEQYQIIWNSAASVLGSGKFSALLAHPGGGASAFEKRDF